MRKVFTSIVALFVCVSLYGGISEDAVRRAMAQDLVSVKQVYSVDYAFGDWKKERFGWDLEAAYDQAVGEIYSMETVSTKAYHRILRDFTTSMKDYHVSVFFDCTEYAYLPFAVFPAQGRYFVVWSGKGCPLKVGDELVRFDGRPVAEVIADLVNEEGKGSPATDQAAVAMGLTYRFAAVGLEVPQGVVTVVTKPKKGREQSFDLEWEYHAEEIPLNPSQCAGFTRSCRMDQSIRSGKKQSAYRQFIKEFHHMTVPLYEHIDRARMRCDNHYELSDREGPLPPLGRQLWKGDESSSFHAYIFQGPKGKKVGYLRIPHYGFAPEELQDLADIINRFEKETDRLVIDQINNGGGDLLFASAIASMLCPESVALPLVQWKLNPSVVHSALEAMKELDEVLEEGNIESLYSDTSFYGYPVDTPLMQSLHDHFKFLVDEWRAGKRETDPYYLLGLSEIGPHPWARYSKPIVLLINELDFSCGDIFPAIMQDMGRVKTIGSRTAGAGGAVWMERFPNHFGIRFTTVTINRIIRQNGQLIENIGVTPDVEFSFTVNDMQNNFADYVKAVNAQLAALR